MVSFLLRHTHARVPVGWYSLSLFGEYNFSGNLTAHCHNWQKVTMSVRWMCHVIKNVCHVIEKLRERKILNIWKSVLFISVKFRRKMSKQVFMNVYERNMRLHVHC